MRELVFKDPQLPTCTNGLNKLLERWNFILCKIVPTHIGSKVASKRIGFEIICICHMVTSELKFYCAIDVVPKIKMVLRPKNKKYICESLCSEFVVLNS